MNETNFIQLVPNNWGGRDGDPWLRWCVAHFNRQTDGQISVQRPGGYRHSRVNHEGWQVGHFSSFK